MSAFSPIGHSHVDENEGAFWPSFTDIMMVVVLIFLLASSLLIVRNWQLVNELQQSIEAEQLAAEMIASTSQENATLEERLTNAEQLNSILRLRILERDEKLKQARKEAELQRQAIAVLEANNLNLSQTIRDTQSELVASRQRVDEISTESENHLEATFFHSRRSTLRYSSSSVAPATSAMAMYWYAARTA